MMTKKIRTEYMKKFRDPKWETFSKCYEDSLKYRLTRRVMEHTHKPWFWEGCRDSGSDSSGRSTPRITRNKVAPLSVKPPTPLELKCRMLRSKSTPEPKPPYENGEPELLACEAAVLDAAPSAEAVLENGLSEPDVGTGNEPPSSSTPSDETTTDDGPADRPSSDEEPAKPEPRRRHHHRTPRSEPVHGDGSRDVRKPSRAKSQPPVSTKERENRRPSNRCDWTEKHIEVRRTQNENNVRSCAVQNQTLHEKNHSRTSNACVQTRRESDKRGSNLERRRARSADVEKARTLPAVDDRWMTEYMRCYSARLRGPVGVRWQGL